MATLPLKFDGAGLVPAVLQDYLTGEIRMFAFATDAAVRSTLESGRATFWSRSRGELWQKGRASGYETPVVRVLADCDGDCIIYSSDPIGPSCFTGARSCFFHAVDGGQLRQATEQPQTIVASIEACMATTPAARGANRSRAAPPAGDPDLASAGAKLAEAASAVGKAIETEIDDRVVADAAEMVYRLLGALRSRGIPWRRVLAELARKRSIASVQPPARPHKVG